jgi:phosphatidylinositol phospholipase C, delta
MVCLFLLTADMYTDLGMQLQDALFQANFQHGYILKPASLLPSSHPHGSHHPTPYESKACRIKLDLHIISGQQLPRPRDYKPGQVIDPYVQIEFIGATGQTHEYRTRAVRDNEFNPMWDERLSFDLVATGHEFIFVRCSYIFAYLTIDFLCIMTRSLPQVIVLLHIVSDYRI